MRSLITTTLLASTLLWGCKGDRTEVIVVVDSDLAVPGELDQVDIEVTAPGGRAQTATTMLGSGGDTLPSTLGLVHRGGPLGPFDLRVTGRQGGVTQVERLARFDFQKGKTLTLRILLARRCRTETCGGSTTCAENGCRPILVGPDELTAWHGVPDPIDGGPPPFDGGFDGGRDGGFDGGFDAAFDACVMMDEVCNGMDDDCDMMIDEDFDLTSDIMNCGMCGNACTPDHATGSCVDSACVIESCDMGFDDCDMDPANGCEVDLTSDPMHCSMCDAACMVSHATAACMDSACAVGACDMGFDDCDTDPGNGCEINLRNNVMHCGACDTPCMLAHATPACMASMCRIDSCDMGFDDCDTDPATGCEIDLRTDPDNCGACGTVCGPAGTGCTARDCDPTTCGASCACPTTRRCNLDCSAMTCSARCRDNSECDVDCAGGSCSVRCDRDSTCRVSCPGGSCSITCFMGATCSFTDCAGGSCTCTGSGTCM